MKTLIEKTSDKLVNAFLKSKIIAPIPSKFCKKIAEAQTLGRSTSTSVPGYITAVNNLLATNQPIAVGPEGIPVVPKPNQRLRIPTTNPTDLKNFEILH